ncbi:formate dehydrogenase accessory protein FdhE [Ammoniphilus sp. YIM 78166]|uniref:formate dehydrogenase accessory protein FdhE n=1 Tax=Ammoniphilus sp. YIM 78166 TaxID=1644106 RepID=UPI0010705DC1|nr:formate dehydrogenase accessory protein FdhE [Ammoniphilus sp. YIM 78166]
MLATVKTRTKSIKEKNKSLKPLADIQLDLIERFLLHSPLIQPFELAEAEKLNKQLHGEYFLLGYEEKVDLTYAIPLFRSLLEWEGVGKSRKPLKILGKSLTNEDISSMLLETLKNEDTRLWQWSSEYNIDIPLLALLAQYSLLPTLVEYSLALSRDFSLDDWKKGYCPICGAHPIMSEIRESEKFRYLRCSSCSCDWLYQRVQCAHCETTDHHQLDYLFIEDENKYRVDVCNQCQTYVKAVHSLSPQAYPMLLLEDLATLHLDLIATEKGYKRY